jgi:3-deoxy-D-manno-octulosonic-acid transferase
MKFLYSLGNQLFEFLLFFYGFFNKRVGQWNKDRSLHFDNLKSIKDKSSARPIVWMHCASLGEFEQGLPLLKEIKLQKPSHFVIVSFFSPSGYSHKRKNEVVDEYFYLPIDTPRHAQKLVEILQPSLFLGVRYEFWWNLLHQLKAHHIPVVFISVVVKPNFYFLSKWLPFVHWLREIDCLFTQDSLSYDLLKQSGCKYVYSVGDTRALSVVQRRDSMVIDDAVYEMIPSEKLVVVYGSIYQSDLRVIGSMMQDKRFYHVVVPHNVSLQKVNDIERTIGCNFPRFSNLNKESTHNGIIVDVIGHLFGLYRYADMVYIGGGFERSIHNTLEPAVFGLPIAIGPKHSLFIEAEDFLKSGIATEVCNESDFSDFVENCLEEKCRESVKQLAKFYFEANSDSVKSIMDHLNSKILH